MTKHPVWSNPDLCSVVSTMMSAGKPIPEVSEEIRAKFGFRLNKNQIAGYYYRFRVSNGITVPPLRPSRFEHLSPVIHELADSGATAKEIAQKTGKAAGHIRSYCSKNGITLAYSVNSSEEKRSRTALANEIFRAKEAKTVPAYSPREGVHFLDRGCGCAFPLWTGRVAFADKHVCGAVTTEAGAPYCAKHAAIAYVGSKNRRQAECQIELAAKTIGKHVNANRLFVAEVA